MMWIQLLLLLFVRSQETLAAEDEIMMPEADLVLPVNAMDDERQTKLSFRCRDSGCEDEGGRCGQFWFSPCKYKTGNLCKGFCTCCVPCGGTCGGIDDGTCKAKCASDEYEVGDNDKCGSFRCKCCKKIPDCTGSCGTGGTCKVSCNPVSEDQVSSSQCSAAGCKCCQPKPGCNGRCGRRNKFYCRRKDTCKYFWLWRRGSCAGSHCRCCSR